MRESPVLLMYCVLQNLQLTRYLQLSVRQEVVRNKEAICIRAVFTLQTSGVKTSLQYLIWALAPCLKGF